MASNSSAAAAAAFFGIRDGDQQEQMKPLISQHQQQLAAVALPGAAPAASNQQGAPAAAPPAKKKRTLPDPDAEVIALSPKTLMATNRFVCEVCQKGFQREQNLQLHRRGHNLPWKLKQKNPNQVQRRRVYLCPEVTCVHHDPSRALGDLTGIKKHFCRKHGEKKWKCDKCAKRYAVQSDWKAHSKTCGTREYRCDCGTLFSRRDSFITHRAFCDALAEETARITAANSGTAASGQGYLFAGSAPPAGMAVRPHSMMLPPPAAAHLIKTAGGQMLGHAAGAVGDLLCDAAGARQGGLSLWGGDNTLSSSMGLQQLGGLLSSGAAGAPMPPQMYADLFAPSSAGAPPQFDMAQLSWMYGNNGGSGKLSSSNASELTTNSSREADSAPSVFSGQHHAKPAGPPTDMSATALLQRAAQIGAVTSSNNASMPAVRAFETAPKSTARDEERSKFFFGAGQQNANVSGAMSEFTAATGSMPYDVFSAARHAGLKDAVGREETRDFLGVGMQAVCSSSIHGWI